MFPYLAKIGTILIPTHAVTMCLAYLIGVIGFVCWVRKAEDMDMNVILNFVFLTVVAAIIGARISAVFMLSSPEQLAWFLSHPVEILKFWKGGESLYGVVIGVIGIGSWYCLRRDLPIRKVTDLTIPWVAIGMLIQHFGCLGAGCHPGTPTDLPWGFIYHHPLFKGPRNVPLHPYPLYMVMMTIPGIILSWSWVKIKYFGSRTFSWINNNFLSSFLRVRFIEGELLLLAGIYYSFFRFFIEFTRHPMTQIYYCGFFLSQSQLACVFIFFLTLFGLLALWAYDDSQKGRREHDWWLKQLLKMVAGMEWVSKRFPWPVKGKAGG